MTQLLWTMCSCDGDHLCAGYRGCTWPTQKSQMPACCSLKVAFSCFLTLLWIVHNFEASHEDTVLLFGILCHQQYTLHWVTHDVLQHQISIQL